MRVVVDLPFVPTTWTASNDRSGLPSRRRRSCIRPRPNSCGQGVSPSSHSTERIELAPVAGELLALGARRPLAARSRRNARSPACPRRGRSPCEDASRSACDVTVHRDALRPHDRLEDAALLLVQREPDTAPAERRGGGLHELHRDGRVLTGSRLRRARRDDQPTSSVRKLRPDLLGHVRHDRVEEREQPLERVERGGDRVCVLLVEAWLDRLRVPVAEVVEGQVVEAVRRGGEVERAEPAFDVQRGRSSMRARIQRSIGEPGRAASSSPPCASRRRAAFQSLFASRLPSSIAPIEKRTSWVEDILQRP